MFGVPEVFAREVERREGERGRAWVAALPGLVEGAVARWELRPSGPVMHGAVGVVVPVRRADGSPAVLKVSFPHPGNLAEPKALAAWAGRGAARLLEHEGFAMVLERAGEASLHDAGDRMEIAGRLNHRLAIQAPDDVPSLTVVAEGWAAEIAARQRKLQAPLADRLVGRALETCRDLAAYQPKLLVHGDLNFSNILRSEREPWLAIDPKGWAGDPAYDAVNLLRDRWHTMPDLAKTLPYQLAAFADAAELERERVLRWVQACAVKDALWSIEFNEPPERATTNKIVAGLEALPSGCRRCRLVLRVAGGRRVW